MVNLMVERATNEMLIGPDWAMNLEICDMLNRDPSQVKDVIKGIKKKLGSKNPKVQILTLTLLETLVKNCGDAVHLTVAERDILHELVRIVKKKPDVHVNEKILVLIDTWQEAFGGPRAKYPQYYAAYQDLLRAGALFPQRSERTAPIFTPPQTQPLSTYPPNVHNSDFPQEAHADTSSQSQLPTLSATEIQNAFGIMDVLSEMLNALEPGNKEGLKQEVIVDLVEQCRTYKQQVVHLVTNTGDETLMCQGLALSDDLDRLLEKHEAIASGAPIRVPHPRVEIARDAVPVDNLLIDTRDYSKQDDKRPATNSSAGSQAEPLLLALPAPTTTPSAPPSVKIDPKIDLLSGDDYNSPTTQPNLALVPVGETQPVISSLSQQTALVLFDFYPENNIPTPSGTQPSYFDGPTHEANPFNQQQNLGSSQPVHHTNGSPLSQQPNPQQSHSMSYAHPTLYANGSDHYPGASPSEQSSFSQSLSPPWSSQQHQPPSSIHDSQGDNSYPPPPWEAQPVENNTTSPAQYPQMQHNGMYAAASVIGGQPFQNNQSAGMVPLPQQLYPQQMYGGYQYAYGYNQLQDPRLLQQQMNGLSMTGNNGGGMMMVNSSYPTASASSHSSAAAAAKPKKSEDKLFGDLVDISKFKASKPTAG